MPKQQGFKTELIDWTEKIQNELAPEQLNEKDNWYSTYIKDNSITKDGIYISNNPGYNNDDYKITWGYGIYFNPITKEVKVQIAEEVN